MLIQFSFKNYKSFKEEAVLDLSASKMTEFSDRVVTIGGEKILPVAAIYGANASGKSNVYSAFEYMSEYVVQSFKYGDEKEDFRATRPAPFLFADDTENAETSFEVYFTIPDDKTERIYNYGFCIDGSGITEEWLNSRAKSAREMSPVFYRDKETLDLSGLPKNSHSNIEVALEKQVLISIIPFCFFFVLDFQRRDAFFIAVIRVGLGKHCVSDQGIIRYPAVTLAQQDDDIRLASVNLVQAHNQHLF